MAKGLTLKQKEVLDSIIDFQKNNGFPPTIRELRDILGLSSLRGVTVHLDALERKEFIERHRTSRSIRIIKKTKEKQSGKLKVLNAENEYIQPPFKYGSNNNLYAVKMAYDPNNNIDSEDIAIINKDPNFQEAKYLAYFDATKPDLIKMQKKDLIANDGSIGIVGSVLCIIKKLI